MQRMFCFAAVLMLAITASATTIRINPSSSVTTPGGTVDLTVDITDVLDLYAYQFDIGFDPAILSALSVNEGAFLSSGGGTLFFPGTIDNMAGTITFTASSLLGAVPGVSGSGTLASIRFQALVFGGSGINLSNTVLLNSISADIPANVQGGLVLVPEPIPEPRTGLLLGSAIGLGLLARYWLAIRRQAAKE